MKMMNAIIVAQKGHWKKNCTKPIKLQEKYGLVVVCVSIHDPKFDEK